jgi:hypothetical protein
LRGAADSLGIITRFWIKTPKAINLVFWDYNYEGFYESAEKATEYFLNIQRFTQNSTKLDRGTSFGMYFDGTAAKIRGKYAGTMEEFNTMYEELTAGIPSGDSRTGGAYYGTWYQSQVFFAGFEDTYNTNNTIEPLTGYDEHDKFFAKSVTVPETTPLTRDAVLNYFTYIIEKGQHAPSNWFSIINLYGGRDSQINSRKGPEYGAYTDRDSLWVIQHYANVNFDPHSPDTSFPQPVMDFVSGLNTALTEKMPNTSFGAYYNYADPTLSVSISRTKQWL